MALEGETGVGEQVPNFSSILFKCELNFIALLFTGMSETNVHILMLFGDVQALLKVSPTIKVCELRRLAASKFKISSNVTLLMFDKEFGEWLVVDDDHDRFEVKMKLKMVVCNEFGKMVDVTNSIEVYLLLVGIV